MGRAALEGGLGRGSYVVGAQRDEGACNEEVRRYDGGVEVWARLTLAGPLEGRVFKAIHTQHYQQL